MNTYSFHTQCRGDAVAGTVVADVVFTVKTDNTWPHPAVITGF